MNLLDFLRQLRKLLDEVIEEAEAYVPAYLAGDLREAWHELAPRFDELERDIQSGDYEEELVRWGLAEGPQFQLKSRGFRRALGLFRRRGGRWALRKALRWADIILDSLASVLPGAGAVKELKETVEQGIEDAEDGSADEMENMPEEEL